MPVMTCPSCGCVIPLGVLAAKCNACGFHSFESFAITPDEITEALKIGATVRRAAERIQRRRR